MPKIINIDVLAPPIIDIEVTQSSKPIPVPEYHGAYTVTPSQQTQVLETAGLKMTNNVTVNPIPSNYGLIGWNGAYMTVS